MSPDLSIERPAQHSTIRRSEVLAGLAAAALAAGRSSAANAQASAPVSLHLASNPNDDVTPVLWAMHTGMFAKAGLDVDLQTLNSGSAVTAALVSGALDVGKSDLLPMVAACSHHVPLKLVAPCSLWLTEKPTSALLVLKDSNIYEARDLNGSVFSSPGLLDLIQVSTRLWLDTHGGNSKTVKFIEVPSGAAFESVVTGRVAGTVLSAAYLSAAMASGKARILGHPNDAIASRFMLSGWISSDAVIAQKRDALTRFVQVVQQAGEYANTHQGETLVLSAQFNSLEPSVLAATQRTFTAPYLEAKDLQPLVNAAAKYGVIPQPFDAQDMISSVALRG